MSQVIDTYKEQVDLLLANSSVSNDNLPIEVNSDYMSQMLHSLNEELITTNCLPYSHVSTDETKDILYSLSPNEIADLNLIYNKFVLFILKSPSPRNMQVMIPIFSHTETLMTIFQKQAQNIPLNELETTIFTDYQNHHRDNPDILAHPTFSEAVAKKNNFFSQLLDSLQNSNLLVTIFDNFYCNVISTRLISGNEQTDEQFTFSLATKLLTGVTKPVQSQSQTISSINILSSLYENATANGTSNILLKSLYDFSDKIMRSLNQNRSLDKSYRILFGRPNLQTEDGCSLNTSRNIVLNTIIKAKKEVETEILATGTSGTGTLQYKFCKCILSSDRVSADSAEKKAAKKYVDQTMKNMKEASFKVLTQADNIAKKHKND
jgi:hypothetical protein